MSVLAERTDIIIEFEFSTNGYIISLITWGASLGMSLTAILIYKY